MLYYGTQEIKICAAHKSPDFERSMAINMGKNSRKRLAVLAAVFVAAIALLGALYFASRPQGTEGKKGFTLEVTFADGTSKSHAVTTDAEFLGAALLENKLIDGSEGTYGFFVTTVDGVTANDAKQEWWCLTIGGETSNYGIDSVPVTDGGHYEFTLMAGWQ